MTNGPPPSSAGTSQNQYQSHPQNYYPSQSQPHPPADHPQYYNQYQPQAGRWQHSAWQVPTYQYQHQPPGPSGAQQPYGQQQQQYVSQGPYNHYQTPLQTSQPQLSRATTYKRQKKEKEDKAAHSKPKPKPKTPSPSPPPPEFHRHWDAVIVSFLRALGLHQALRGFENDMLVMNDDWERSKVPKAIGELMRDMMSLGQSPNIDRKERTQDERKLDYVHLTKGAEALPQTSINKQISQFLAQNQARNDASNRREFLLSLDEKRKRLFPDGSVANIPESEGGNSCARTDAKFVDRDIQMKYDVVRNEEGPLRRTVKVHSTQVVVKDDRNLNGKGKRKTVDDEDGVDVGAERHPGLDERLKNIETHLSVRYVPSPPRSLLHRLKFLEEHLIKLEKEYPPWAALHFNQPHRGWPAPPRPKPIIVPSHLTSTSEAQSTIFTSNSTSQLPGSINTKEPKLGNPKSSLQRAVLEKLEVQKAKDDLAGRAS